MDGSGYGTTTYQLKQFHPLMRVSTRKADIPSVRVALSFEKGTHNVTHVTLRFSILTSHFSTVDIDELRQVVFRLLHSRRLARLHAA
jgi:hypothetical protein